MIGFDVIRLTFDELDIPDSCGDVVIKGVGPD